MTATVFILVGARGTSDVECWLAAGRMAAVRDTVRALEVIPEVARIVIATRDREQAEQHADLPVTWDHDPASEQFHFGRRLAGLLTRYPSRVAAYLGAGSLPLLPVQTLAQVFADVARAPAPLSVTNNLHSSDWMVCNCPEAVTARPDRLERDNALGWVLMSEAGVEVRSLEPSAATRMDLDTPADLLLLGLHPQAGREAAAYLRAHARDGSRWVAAGRTLFTPGSQVALIGRVSSGVWSFVERHTQVWIRVFSEERGMAASGRQSGGQARSLIGAHLARLGPQAFFEELAEMVGAVLFDTRVALAHHRLWPSPAERYASDLGLVDQIQDDFLRGLTAAAMRAPIPVVLGGHGVVAGDLYALVELGSAGALDGL